MQYGAVGEILVEFEALVANSAVDDTEDSWLTSTPGCTYEGVGCLLSDDENTVYTINVKIVLRKCVCVVEPLKCDNNISNSSPVSPEVLQCR